MKLVSRLITWSLFCISMHTIAAPVAPVLTYSIDGTTITVSWNEVPGANQYKLSYAPVPYIGPQSIGTVDVGTQTSFSTDLWEGAAFYIAVQAGDDQGFSRYSNIESFTIIPSSPSSINLSGNWMLTETSSKTDCGSVTKKLINGIVEISQLNDTVTIKFPGGSVIGDILDNEELGMFGNISEDGGGTTQIVMDFFITPGNPNLSGFAGWTWVNGSTECSGSSNILLSK